MSNLKAVQIGCGSRAQKHARAIAQVERLDFAATCDLIEERARKTADANSVHNRILIQFRSSFRSPPSAGY